MDMEYSLSSDKMDQLFQQSCPSACPYIKGKVERQLFTLLEDDVLDEWSDRLNQLGFRRSLNCVYMPDCADCQACKSVRVRVGDFQRSKSLKRIWRRNADLRFERDSGQGNPERYALLQRYLRARHSESDMNDIDAEQFQQLTETVPSKAFALSVYAGAELLGVMMVDDFSDGYSAVYSYFTPDMPERSLGIMLALVLLDQAAEAGKKYVYLGYYIAEVANMAYKARFAPLERFDWESMSWQDFNPVEIKVKD